MRAHVLADELHGHVDRARLHHLLDGILEELEDAHGAGRVLYGLHAGCVVVSATDQITIANTDQRPEPLPPETSRTGENTAASNVYAFGNIMRDLVLRYAPGEAAALELASACTRYEASDRPTAAGARQRLAGLGWAGPIAPWQERFEPTDPDERALIANLADDATRRVYADWLEQHGFDQRAAFVRSELATTPDREAALRALSPASDLVWRRATSRGTIRACLRGSCPERWDALARIVDDDRRRTCTTCAANVRYVATAHEAHEVTHDWRQIGPIVLDASLPSALAAPPPPAMNPPPPGLEPRSNPPAPHEPEAPKQDGGVLARFLGWFKRGG